MPNSGSKHPKKPVRVVVQNVAEPNEWQLGLTREWRWVDEAATTWEGRVDTGTGQYSWISGERLRRVERDNSPR